MNRYDIAKGIKPESIKNHHDSSEDSTRECKISVVKKESMSIHGKSYNCNLKSMTLNLNLNKLSYEINMEVQSPHDFYIEPKNPILMTLHGQEFTIIPEEINYFRHIGITKIYGWTEGCKFKRISGVRVNITRSGNPLGIRGSRRVPRNPRGFTGISG